MHLLRDGDPRSRGRTDKREVRQVAGRQGRPRARRGDLPAMSGGSLPSKEPSARQGRCDRWVRNKPRQRKRRYRPVVDRGCSKKKAHKTQAEAQVVVDQIKARRVFILGLGAPSTYRCGRCGYWHLGSAALELRRLLPLSLAMSMVVSGCRRTGAGAGVAGLGRHWNHRLHRGRPRDRLRL